MKAVLSFIVICVTFSFSCYSKEHAKNNYQILKAAQTLPHIGILTQARDGYVYLKVSDDYVYDLFPLLKEKGFHIPGSFQRDSPIRAHISVIYKEDGARLSPIKQLGQSYSFTPTEVVEVRNGDKKYIILEVNAPELGILRKSYGLSPKIFDHEYHITIAEKHIH